jgi:hypothetical protein
MTAAETAFRPAARTNKKVACPTVMKELENVITGLALAR